MGRRRWLAGKTGEGADVDCLSLSAGLQLPWNLGLWVPIPDACFPSKGSFHTRQLEVSDRSHSQERRRSCYSGQNFELGIGKPGSTLLV